MEICIIAVLNLLFFFKTLRLGLVCDDIPTFKSPPKFKNKLHKWYLQIFGMAKFNVPIDHLITMITHTVTAIFVYLAFGANQMSFVASLLFSFNPSNSQGSVWLSGRGYVLPTMFLLMALSLPIVQFPWQLGLPALGLLLCSAFYHPAYLCLIVVLGHPNWMLIAFVPFVWWFHYKRFFGIVKCKQDKEAVPEDRRIAPRKLILFFKTLGYYFCHSLFPIRLSFFHSYFQSMAGNEIMKKRAYSVDKYLFIGISVVLAMITATIMKLGIVGYGLWWYCVCIAPYCNLIRVQQEIAERYMYMASVGLMVALASLIYMYPVIVAFIIGAYMARLWFYYRVCYVDDYWLVETAVCECPSSWFAWHSRGHKRMDQGALREALNMWVMAKMMSPKEFKVLYNIGCVCALVKKPNDAEEHWKLAEANVVEGQEEMSKNILKDARSGKIQFLY